ncbi:MAG: hypothetical protein HQL58_00100 [Magnetococcales bacterium]|nr:hypothetical protein [Magnetococcales bacterium]
MNTKNFKEQANLRRAGMAARHAVDSINPDVLIAIDDDAQEWVARHYVNHPSMQIVHAGINSDPASYGYKNARNVTGILERKPLKAIQEMILLIGAKSTAQLGIGTTGIGATGIRALFLSDSSKSVAMDSQFLASYDWAPVDYRGNRAVRSFQEWQEVIRHVDELADVVLVGGYRELTRANGVGFVSPQEVMSWTEQHSSKPVIGMNVFNAADGAMLSLGVSPFEQGEVAARMSLQIMDNDMDASTLATQNSEQYALSMRQSALRRRGIQLPSIFEAFSRSTNNFLD